MLKGNLCLKTRTLVLIRFAVDGSQGMYCVEAHSLVASLPRLRQTAQTWLMKGCSRLPASGKVLYCRITSFEARALLRMQALREQGVLRTHVPLVPPPDENR